MDGKPLTGGAGGSVVLVPMGNARPSFGKLDNEGRFVLTCDKPGDGTVRGRHQVAVAAREKVGEDSVRWLTPKKYADPGTSGIEVEIDAPTKSLRIDLTWAGGAPFVERATH